MTNNELTAAKQDWAEEDDRIQGRFLDHLTHELLASLGDYKAVLQSCHTLEEAKAISERLDLVGKLIAQAQDDAADLVNQLGGE